MADQNITALPVATLPESSDQLLLVGATEEKLIDYDKLADAILGKIASKNFALDQGNKTLLQALNELNSKASVHAFEDNANIDGLNLKSGMYIYNGYNPTYFGIKPFSDEWGIFFVGKWLGEKHQFCISAKTSVCYHRFAQSDEWSSWY